MICVSIGRGRHRMMIAEHAHLAEQGVEVVELRLDYIRRPVNLRRLLDDRPCQVVATCRRPADGGKWMRSEDDRRTLLRTAIADQADYVDLEWDIASNIPRYGSTKRIISYHNFDETPEHLDDIHEKLCGLDPDIVKIATMANNPLDNIRALRLCRDSEVPTVAFCMGELGMPSRILCGRFGAPMTYATFHEDRQMAPGQLSYKQMANEFNYDRINSETEVLGVIADPVEHSLSPVVHNAQIRKADLNMIYLPFRVQAEYLNDFIQICPEMGVRGLSVTIPHKETILRNVNVLDDDVASVKAANTVVFKGNNAFGFNTDCRAAIESLESAIATHANDHSGVQDKQVLILGAGGVARAIATTLKRAGAEVHISARDFRKGEELANELECKAIDWPGRQNFECRILINCTPVGMHPNLDETPYDGSWFTSRMVVFDTVYNPEQTLFVKQAREHGCLTITGVDMFVRQAAAQFKHFTGRDADIELVRYEVKRAISAARY
ncbi:MAG: shikimate dehydrogenase [Planctomycetota bacterium]